jgi:hypothetical protein
MHVHFCWGNSDRLSIASLCTTGVTDVPMNVGFMCDNVAVLGKIQKMQPVLLQNVTQQDNGYANIYFLYISFWIQQLINHYSYESEDVMESINVNTHKV